MSLGSLEQSGTVTLTNGDDVVCTFTNSRLPSLTLVKKVVNDNGGTASVTDFGITTSAGELTFGDAVEVPTNTFTYTSQTITGLTLDTYTLNEDDVVGYAEGESITGATSDSSEVMSGTQPARATPRNIGTPGGSDTDGDRHRYVAYEPVWGAAR